MSLNNKQPGLNVGAYDRTDEFPSSGVIHFNLDI